MRIFPFRCRRWRCERCGKQKVEEARQRLKAGMALGPTIVITLTSPGCEDPVQSFEELTRRWKRLHRRLELHFGRFEFGWVVECQRRGSPHLHIIIRGIRPPNRWLSDAARDVGFGKVTDVRATHSGTADYLMKELGPGSKGDALPAHRRRVFFSAGWAPRARKGVQAGRGGLDVGLRDTASDR